MRESSASARASACPSPGPCKPHYYRPNVDAFRNVAEAYGDDNPL